MITEQEFQSFLKRPESNTFDFKSTAYNLSDEKSKSDFIKDVLCMANTPREETSYIVLGVRKNNDGSVELLGLDRNLDGANLQSQIDERVYPVPVFTYEELPYKGKTFGVIAIPPEKNGPYLMTINFNTSLRKDTIYFRRDSKNDKAKPEDTYKIMTWFKTGNAYPAVLQHRIPQWENFIEAVHSFEQSRRYVLITGLFRNENPDIISAIGRVPWAWVLDLDHESQSFGLLKAVKTQIEAHRSLHYVVAGNRPTLNLDRGTYWFFARGKEGQETTLATGSWKDWKTRYGIEIQEQFKELAKTSKPLPVTCVVLWFETNLINHLKSCLEAALSAFEDTVEFVFVTKHPTDLDAVVEDFEATSVDISLQQLCSGLQVLLSSPAPTEEDQYLLPGSEAAPCPVDLKDQNWLEEELDIIHLNVGKVSPDGRDVPRDFLRGAEITWYELNHRYDVDRDDTEKLKRRVEFELANKRTVRVNLYHEHGAGGTTVARRILWDLHRNYPCAVLLHNKKAAETAERLFRIASLTEQAVLLLIDSAQITGRQVDDLYDYLRSQHIPVVILQVLRRFKPPKPYLKAELKIDEVRRLIEKLSQTEPQKRGELERLITSSDKRNRTAFFIGLQTFGRDFIRLEEYVSNPLSALTSVQRQILVFLALAHHYAQTTLRGQVFAELLNIPKNRTVKLEEIFSEEVRYYLLIEEQRGIWRTAHDLIAIEILEQILCPDETERMERKRLLRDTLANVAISFAKFCRGTSTIPSEEMLEIVRRTFIYRDNSELLGTEKSWQPQFSQLIEDIPISTGKLRVLEELTKLYPEEAHFWAHLGRFYAIPSEMCNYERALECIDIAISINPERDPVIHHMKGIAIRRQIQGYIGQRAELEEVVKLAERASESFEKSRDIKPDSEHGYISELETLISVLEYAGSQYGGVLEYLKRQKVHPFLRDAFDRAEDLLEQVRQLREGEGGTSLYEEQCRAKLDNLYERHDQALRIWDSLLNRSDANRPPLRRQIIRTYLARPTVNRSWDKLTPKDSERIINLLQSNLDEDPNNSKDLRLWLQAIRQAKNPPSIESVIERVTYWKTKCGTLEATYYLYVLWAIQTLQNFALAREEANRYLEECRQLTRYRRNRTISFEWLSNRSGVKMLIHHLALGRWSPDKDFWETTDYLKRERGYIRRIIGQQSGEIEVKGLRAFFVPGRSHTIGRSENQLVDFYLGFSYEGLRAWDVKNVTDEVSSSPELGNQQKSGSFVNRVKEIDISAPPSSPDKSIPALLPKPKRKPNFQG